MRRRRCRPVAARPGGVAGRGVVGGSVAGWWSWWRGRVVVVVAGPGGARGGRRRRGGGRGRWDVVVGTDWASAGAVVAQPRSATADGRDGAPAAASGTAAGRADRAERWARVIVLPGSGAGVGSGADRPERAGTGHDGTVTESGGKPTAP